MQWDAQVEHTFPDIRIGKRKHMDGEETMDEPAKDSFKRYEINNYT